MTVEEEQWDLIAGKWSTGEEPGSLTQLAIEGSFLDVLTSPSGRRLLSPFARAVTSLQHPQATSKELLHLPLDSQVVSSDALAVAVSSLHAFVQLNWTGPDVPEELSHPATLLRKVCPDAFPARSPTSDDNIDNELETALQRACLEELTWNGEPAYHLCRSAFLLFFALRILQSLPAELVTLSWWRLRAESIHSRILDTPIMSDASLFRSLSKSEEHLTHLQSAASSSQEKQRWGALLARLYIDQGLARQRCDYDKEASDFFVKAALVSGLNYELTGSLGKRTKFQREEKTILVLLAESTLVDKDEDAAKEDESAVGEEYDENPVALPSNNSGWKAGPSANREAGMPSEMVLNDDTLLEQTRFTSSTGSASSLARLDASKPTVLHPLDASILLSLSLNVKNASPENGLTSSQIAAFVSRVLAHARNWSVHTMALLLRSRLEANRTRTAERSVLQLQALLDQMPTSDSTLQDRLLYFHQLELPSMWDMQAELARRYAALGVIRSALEIFERVEMWEEAVQCWGALGRQDRAIEVVRDLLEGRIVESSQAIRERKQRSEENGNARQTLNKAREAKLWCLLGDLELDKAEEHYNKAWQVSSQRSARAARSIAGLYFARDDFQQTILWLRRALKVNPLYHRSWFILGCAYMKLDSPQAFFEAARCFRRCTSLDDEDGESWNNLASCYLRLSQQGRSVLYDAHVSENGDSARDASEVLRGVREDAIDSDTDTDDSLHSRDSGVAVDNSDTDEEEEEDGQRESLPSDGGSSTAFDVKLLAHRALTKSLRFSHDDWRIWNNYMIVSVDCGLMGEAVRGMSRVVELRTSKASIAGDTSDRQSIIDVAVLNRLVDAVIRAPSREEDAVENGDVQNGQANHSPHEGHGLYPSLSILITDIILPRFSSSAAIYQAYARLLFWRGLLRSSLEAHLNAWRVSFGSDTNVQVTTEKAIFVEAVEELRQVCEILENLGGRPVQVSKEGHEIEGDVGIRQEEAMANWKFRARSLIRSFIGRTRDSFEGEPEWEDLLALRDSFTT